MHTPARAATRQGAADGLDVDEGTFDDDDDFADDDDDAPATANDDVDSVSSSGSVTATERRANRKSVLNASVYVDARICVERVSQELYAQAQAQRQHITATSFRVTDQLARRYRCSRCDGEQQRH
jgi:hypothetical protein